MSSQAPRAGFRASPEEARAFLAAHPGIAFFEVFFTNMSGVPRGKRLRRHEIMAVYEQGRFLPVSLLVVDINGTDVPDTGLVWEEGDADRIAWPVPGGIAPAPWLGEDVGQVMCSLHELEGPVCQVDPRAVLQRVIDRYTADGMVPVVACELEYYLVDGQRTAGGGIALAPSQVNGASPRATEVYGLHEIEDAGRFLRDLWVAADAQNIPLEGVISECAPGQIELTLTHKPDGLRAADDATAYKRATFMAKPFAEEAGSGLHLHMSVNDKAGANLMASEAPEGPPLLRHAIGGMARLLGESMAIFAPNANSYRRFRANSYAPVAPTWGVNNRTVALRVPAGKPHTRHIEHRVAGADANPYLALAAVLAAAHYGITHKIDPGPPVVGDGYAAVAAGNGGSGAKLPTNWFAAVDAFAASEVLRDYLGEDFVRHYTTVKRTEQDRFFAAVPTLDYDWYLANA